MPVTMTSSLSARWRLESLLDLRPEWIWFPSAIDRGSEANPALPEAPLLEPDLGVGCFDAFSSGERFMHPLLRYGFQDTCASEFHNKKSEPRAVASKIRSVKIRRIENREIE